MEERIPGFQIVEVGEKFIEADVRDEFVEETDFGTQLLQNQEAAILASESTTKPSHAHHWVIETPNGPTSQGYCENCGAVREFKNWLPELEFINGQGSDGEKHWVW